MGILPHTSSLSCKSASWTADPAPFALSGSTSMISSADGVRSRFCSPALPFPDGISSYSRKGRNSPSNWIIEVIPLAHNQSFADVFFEYRGQLPVVRPFLRSVEGLVTQVAQAWGKAEPQHRKETKN